MSPKSTGKTGQLVVRLEPEFLERLDTLAKRLSQPGLTLGRSDVVRMIITEGLPRLEATAARRK